MQSLRAKKLFGRREPEQRTHPSLASSLTLRLLHPFSKHFWSSSSAQRRGGLFTPGCIARRYQERFGSITFVACEWLCFYLLLSCTSGANKNLSFLPLTSCLGFKCQAERNRVRRPSPLTLALQTRLQDPALAPDVQLLLLVQSNPPAARCLATSPRFALHRCSHLAEDNLLPAPSGWRHRDLCLVSRRRSSSIQLLDTPCSCNSVSTRTWLSARPSFAHLFPPAATRLALHLAVPLPNCPSPLPVPDPEIPIKPLTLVSCFKTTSFEANVYFYVQLPLSVQNWRGSSKSKPSRPPSAPCREPRNPPTSAQVFVGKRSSKLLLATRQTFMVGFV
ncbi:uncharacterized protein LJ206_020653 [Theristicus caerulescens]